MVGISEARVSIVCFDLALALVAPSLLNPGVKGEERKIYPHSQGHRVED